MHVIWHVLYVQHVAIDHAWVTTHPHYLVQSRHGEHLRDPGGYFAANERMFAYGRGLLWEPWEDTVQLNYGEPEVRQAMLSVLKKIAGICDGVRCDVAMLVEQELLQSTWGNQLLPEPGLKALASQQVNSEFWPTACSKTRQLNPSFVFIAESYWEREKPLMDKGFDFCYDKVFYDRLVLGDGEGVDALLNLDRGYQDKLVRFLGMTAYVYVREVKGGREAERQRGGGGGGADGDLYFLQTGGGGLNPSK